jgi:ureidoglycolate hydrolase
MDKVCSSHGPGWSDLMTIGLDDRPDLSTLRAFVASVAQGVVYDTGIWHHPLICLETVRESFLVTSFDPYGVHPEH